MSKGHNHSIGAWIRSQIRPHASNTIFALLLVAAAFSTWLAYVTANPGAVGSKGIDELYAISSLAQGLVFGFYSSHVISKWWDLRVGTGTVSGALADLAMVLKGYFMQVSVPQPVKDSLARKLKLVHALHLCEVFRITPSHAHIRELTGVTSEGNGPLSLIACLSEILGEVTILSEQVGFSDSVKFSILPAVQANLSAIRSSSGDCTMILNTKLPKVSVWFVHLFTAVHVMYLPVYLGSRTSWDPFSVLVGASMGAAAIVGFLLIVNHGFENPFVTNGFRLESIVQGTFEIIDECLRGPIPSGQKARKRS